MGRRTKRNAARDKKATAHAGTGLWWRLGVIVIAGGLAYANSLSGPFMLDDTYSVVENPTIHQWSRPASVLFPPRNSPVAGRPAVNLSFAINYAIGGLAPYGYHLANIALHLLCALLVFGILRRTISVNFAFAAALIWTLHPLNSEVVDYLTERSESMMTLGYLLTLYASVRAASRDRVRMWQTVAVLACAMGMASKESMVTAPLIVILYDRIFLFDSLKEAVHRRWRFYLALAATWVLLAGLMWSGPRANTVGFSTKITPWTYLLNQTVMIAQYLRRAIWPRSLVLNYGWPLPLTLGDVIPYALLIVALVAATVIALTRWPKLGFWGAWFFITLAPTSTIVPIASEVGAERRMYLPLVAVVVLMIIGVMWLWEHLPASQLRLTPYAAPVALAVVSMALAAGTIARNREYTSTLTLAQTVLERWPSSMAHYLVGTESITAGLREEGVAHLRQATGDIPRAHYTLGWVLFNDGKLDEAIRELQTFVAEQPLALEAVPARAFMGQAYGKQGRWADAAEQYRLVLTMQPSNVDAQNLLAEALFSQGKFDEAIARYRQYLELRPNDWQALTNAGIALIGSGKLDEAIVLFRRAAEINPMHGQTQRNLANALYDHGDLAQARASFERALQVDPADTEARDGLRRILQATRNP